MARKKKPLPILENVTITDCAAEGKCIARVNDMVVFVPFVVPGDVVDLQVRKKRHSYCEAEAIRMIQPSAVRSEPFCPHFGVCGGCKWQILPYEEQIRMKQRQVFDQLTRIGKVELPEFRPILGSARTTEYRNKMEFACSNKRWLTPAEISSGVTYEQMNANPGLSPPSSIILYHPLSSSFVLFHPLSSSFILSQKSLSLDL